MNMNEDINDLMEADSWDHMVDPLRETNETLEARFRQFSVRADKWLLDEWKKRLKEKTEKPAPWDTEERIERSKEIIGILEKVIEERT